MDEMVAQWKMAAEVPKAAVRGATITEEAGGKLLVALDPVSIAAGMVQNIAIDADIPWRPYAFFVVEEICHHFELLEMVCCRISLSTRKPIPCELFSTGVCSSCQKTRLAKIMSPDWPIVGAGLPMRLSIRNRSDVAATLRSGFWANTVDYSTIQAERYPGL